MRGIDPGIEGVEFAAHRTAKLGCRAGSTLVRRGQQPHLLGQFMRCPPHRRATGQRPAGCHEQQGRQQDRGGKERHFLKAEGQKPAGSGIAIEIGRREPRPENRERDCQNEARRTAAPFRPPGRLHLAGRDLFAGLFNLRGLSGGHGFGNGGRLRPL